MKTPPKRPRTRNPVEHRRRILYAAVQLFAHQGFERTTTREIAQVAGVSEGSIYVHFPSKQDLLLEFVRSAALEPVAEILGRKPGCNEAETLRALAHNRLEMWAEVKDLARIAFGEAFFNPEVAGLLRQDVFRTALEKVRAYITSRMADGTFRRADPEVVSRLLLSMFFGTFVLWGFIVEDFPGKITPAMIEKTLPDLFLHGILTPPDPASNAKPSARAKRRRPKRSPKEAS